MVFAHAQPPSGDAGSFPAGGPRGASVSPPEQPGGQSDSTADSRQAPPSRVVRLKRRPEFLAVAATGQRWVAPAFVLQTGPRPAGSTIGHPNEIGLGFTATRRLGNAVARNRAKRRLREATRLLLPGPAIPRHDYVLVAREAVLTCPFATLLDDLAKAFSRVLTTRPRPMGRRSAPQKRKKTSDPSQSGS